MEDIKPKSVEEAMDETNRHLETAKNSVFPSQIKVLHENGDVTGYVFGLTIRELFAAMAMQGYLNADLTNTPRNIARMSVDQADALIEELENKK